MRIDRIRPRNPEFFTNSSLAKPGRNSLSWITPCFTPAACAARARAIASSTVGAVGFSIWMCFPAAIAWCTRAGRSPVAAQSMKIASGPANASSRLAVQRRLPCTAASAFNRPASRPTNSRSGINRSPLRNARPPSPAMASRFAMCWVVPIRPVAPLIMTPMRCSLMPSPYKRVSAVPQKPQPKPCSAEEASTSP